MRPLLSLLLAFAFITPAFATEPPSWCVRVYISKRGNDNVPESMGSGSLISPTRVVTNHHVVEGRESDDSVEILFGDWTVITGKVVAESEQWDLAIIEIEAVKYKPLPIGDEPTPSTIGAIHGYGYGPYRTVPGLISGFVDLTKHGMGSTEGEEKDDFRIIIGAGARSGDSGGAVVSDGKMVGILNMSNGKNTLFIVPTQLRNLLKTLDN